MSMLQHLGVPWAFSYAWELIGYSKIRQIFYIISSFAKVKIVLLLNIKEKVDEKKVRSLVKPIILKLSEQCVKTAAGPSLFDDFDDA